MKATNFCSVNQLEKKTPLAANESTSWPVYQKHSHPAQHCFLLQGAQRAPRFTQLCCSCTAGSSWWPTVTAYAVCVNSSNSPVSEGQRIQPENSNLEFYPRKGKQLTSMGSESHFSTDHVMASLWLHFPTCDCL